MHHLCACICVIIHNKVRGSVDLLVVLVMWEPGNNNANLG